MTSEAPPHGKAPGEKRAPAERARCPHVPFLRAILARWRPILVAALALAVSLGTLDYQLVFDDHLIVQNVRDAVRERGASGILVSEFVVNKQYAAPAKYYRPIVLASFWVGERLGGAGPVFLHALNVFLHTANALLVYRLGILLPLAPSAALCGAALFAVHPVHVESVAFASGQTDLWMTFFLLLAAVVWFRALRHPGETRLSDVAAGFAAFLLGMLSKEAAIMLPPVLLFWDALRVVPQGCRPGWWARNKPWILGWSAAAAIAGCLRLATVGFGSHVGLQLPNEAGPGLQVRVAAAFFHLRLLVLPWPLNAFYVPSQVVFSLPNLAGAGVAVAVIALTTSSREKNIGWLAFAWVIGFLLPTSGFFTINAAPVAERFLYLPSVMWCLAAGTLAGRAAAAPALRRAVFPSFALICAVMVMASLARNRVWRDDEALSRDLVKSTPGLFVGHRNLAIILARQGRHREALPYFREALRLYPQQADLYQDFGIALQETGQLEEAVRSYRRAVELGPNLVTARLRLGDALAGTGRAGESAAQYEEVLRLDPGNARARNGLDALPREGR